jgi:signal peptidase I
MGNNTFIRFYSGHSMKGTFYPGDYLVVKRAALCDILSGDVVVYQLTDEQGDVYDLAHRVVASLPDGLMTKGDNNPFVDKGLVTEKNLLGTVVSVERRGKERMVRRGRFGVLHARSLQTKRLLKTQAWRLAVTVGRRPYRWLQKSGLIYYLWRPYIQRVCLETKEGPLIKYISGKRTVARWWPEKGRFHCTRPYNLVIDVGKQRKG